MTENEFAEGLARMQAMGIVNRQLIAMLYEIVLRDDPAADAKLREISAQLVPFFEDTPNKVAAANMVDLTDSFIASLRTRLGLP